MKEYYEKIKEVNETPLFTWDEMEEAKRKNLKEGELFGTSIGISVGIVIGMIIILIFIK